MQESSSSRMDPKYIMLRMNAACITRGYIFSYVNETCIVDVYMYAYPDAAKCKYKYKDIRMGVRIRIIAQLCCRNNDTSTHAHADSYTETHTWAQHLPHPTVNVPTTIPVCC